MENKLYTWSKNGMKMIIHTDFKEFNRQTNCISRGNVIANTMYSNYIRPYDETINPIGKEVEPGHLQAFDLKYFSISNELRDFIEKQEKQVCLYEFFIYKGNYRDIIGHIVIKDGKIPIYKKIQDSASLNCIQREKRQNVLDYCEKILLMEE